MEETLTERLRRMADRLISERPSDRVLNFTLDDQKYWIKRKLGNGRNQLVKYSVEKEFYYEIARMTIAGRNNPDLVPEIEVLTPDYMVTKDGGPTVKNWLDSDKSEAEKELILEEAGAALAALHKNGIVHGRPALRDITWNDGVIHFLDWKTACTPRTRLRRKRSISSFFFRESTAKTILKPAKEQTPLNGATSKTAAKKRERKRAVS